MRKKLLTGLFSLVMLFAAPAVLPEIGGGDSSAVITAEALDFSYARDIEVNTEYSDRLNDANDERYYRFTADANGKITVSFGKEYAQAGATGRLGWMIYLYDSEQKQIDSYAVTTGNTETVKSTNYGLKKGTYYIRVKKFDYYTGVGYTVKVNYTKSDYWDYSTDDNSFDTARSIKTDTKYYGTIHNSSDLDFYKFSVPATGYVDLKFGKNYDTSATRKGWQAELYDPNFNLINRFYVSSGDSTYAIAPKVGLSKGTYYLKVKGRDAISRVTYSVNVRYTEDAYWEKELNDEQSKARTIYAARKYYGTIHNGSDVDWYKFNNEKTSVMPIVFGKDTDQAATRKGWTITVYNSNMQQIKYFSVLCGDSKTIFESADAPKGTVYIRVKSADASTSVKYSLRVGSKSITTAKASIPYSSYTYTGSAIKPTVTVKSEDGIKLSKDVDYTVSYSNNTKVGIATIKITGKGVYTGSISKTFVVKPARNEITSISSTSGAFKIKWKKGTAGTVGYQVLYSTDKNFKKNVHSYTSTKLSDLTESFSSVPKTGETWYVKVRSFYTKDGKTTSTRYGNYSAVKSIKVK